MPICPHCEKESNKYEDIIKCESCGRSYEADLSGILPKEITRGDKYDPAMKINDPHEAIEYLKMCIEHNMGFGENNREEAEEIEKENIAYYAGYHDNDTRERVEKLFKCAHPMFGPIAEKGPPTQEEAFNIDLAFGEKHKKKE